MKKMAIAMGITFALSMGVPGKAHATAGYLSSPIQPGSSPNVSALFNSLGPTTTSYTLLYTTTSLYGDTLPLLPPSGAPPGSGSVTQITESGYPSGTSIPVYYNGSSLVLSQIASTGIQSWYSTNSNGTKNGLLSGNYISQVFQIQSASTMPGATPGDLIFTYQFSVLTDTAQPGTAYVNNTSVADFNEPNSSTLWNLGAGINTDSSGTYTPLGTSLTGTTQETGGFISQGFTYANPVNETINSLSFQWNPFFGGDVSPQVFVASNAQSFTGGTLTFNGAGFGAGFSPMDVYVPGITPEPSTLVLLGSALGILCFMAYRKKNIFMEI